MATPPRDTRVKPAHWHKVPFVMPTALEKPDVPQRIVLNGVSWEYYEQTLKEIGNQPIRVSYLDGMMELMSPLPKHEGIAGAIGDLVKAFTEVLDIPRKAYRSATFRREQKSAGSEPDECFYFHETASVTGMERFDPLVHRAPDLWIEVDLFSPSVAREAIYARLGVPEVWRFSEDKLTVRLLTPEGVYTDSPTSRAFPFLPIEEFFRFIGKMRQDNNETRVLREFREWVGNLSR
jgi:Uma2 family endonuclease